MTTRTMIFLSVAVLSIAFLEYTAIANGMNGQAFAFSIGSIAGLAGYNVSKLKKRTPE